jgi:hypothetical protein
MLAFWRIKGAKPKHGLTLPGKKGLGLERVEEAQRGREVENRVREIHVFSILDMSLILCYSVLIELE